MTVTAAPRTSRRPACLLAAVASGMLLGLATLADAQTIFKSVDSSGRVIYSQEPVAGAISVEKVDVSPKVQIDRAANPAGGAAADAKRAETARQSDELRQRQLARDAQRQKAQEAVAAAERDLAQAQRALEQGQVSDQPGDRQGIGGVRSRPTEQYLARVKQLEQEVEAAKKRLAAALDRLREAQ